LRAHGSDLDSGPEGRLYDRMAGAESLGALAGQQRSRWPATPLSGVLPAYRDRISRVGPCAAPSPPPSLRGALKGAPPGRSGRCTRSGRRGIRSVNGLFRTSAGTITALVSGRSSLGQEDDVRCRSSPDPVSMDRQWRDAGRTGITARGRPHRDKGTSVGPRTQEVAADAHSAAHRNAAVGPASV